MLSMIRELRQMLKMKTLIMDAFVPVKEVETVKACAEWDEDEDEWKLRRLPFDKANWPQRPESVHGYPQPTTEYARMSRTMGDCNPRFMYDSIAVADLDMPERTTEDYEVNPFLGERIERALTLALSPNDDEDDAQQQGTHHHQ